MYGFRIVTRQILASLVGNDSSFVIGSCYSPDGVNRVPEHDCDELDFIASLPRQSEPSDLL